ncbi:nucleotide-binding universal stress UspA family protein [Pedobacter sp. CAN_A7]|uniref:universal stress protein n=1 Tax=Pedobacter sp. CAN_A7 TaxID=2787722 RepID=UPI0018C9D737
MKKILIPTDFSDPSINAARFALALANVVDGQVLLCHAFGVPVQAPMAAQVSLPVIDYATVQQQTQDRLTTLSNQLEEEASKGWLANARPIKFTADGGPFADVINGMVEKEKANMLIMGMSGDGAVSQFFLGSCSREMISDAKIPVLLVPPAATFMGINKIAFATDLSEGDIDVIHSLATFASQFNAEILVAHVSEGQGDDDKQRAKIADFLNDISSKVNYPRIYFRDIKQMSVDEGLDWLTEHGQIDMLVMVHQRSSLIDVLFNRSHTQKLARRIEIPLLVYPGYLNHVF